MKKARMKLTNIGMMGYNMLSEEDFALLLTREKDIIDQDLNLLSQETGK